MRKKVKFIKSRKRRAFMEKKICGIDESGREI